MPVEDEYRDVTPRKFQVKSHNFEKLETALAKHQGHVKLLKAKIVNIGNELRGMKEGDVGFAARAKVQKNWRESLQYHEKKVKKITSDLEEARDIFK